MVLALQCIMSGCLGWVVARSIKIDDLGVSIPASIALILNLALVVMK